MVRRLSRLLSPLALTGAISLVVMLAFQNRSLRDEAVKWRRRALYPYAGVVVPALPAQALNGDSVTLGGPAPGRRQVLLVFNTTCGFCLETLPAWKTLFLQIRNLHSVEADVVGVSLDPPSETVHYVDEHGLLFPVVTLLDARQRRLYRAEGVPLTLVVNDEGVLVYARLGALKDAASIDSVIAAAAPSWSADITSSVR